MPCLGPFQRNILDISYYRSPNYSKLNATVEHRRGTRRIAEPDVTCLFQLHESIFSSGIIVSTAESSSFHHP